MSSEKELMWEKLKTPAMPKGIMTLGDLLEFKMTLEKQNIDLDKHEIVLNYDEWLDYSRYNPVTVYTTDGKDHILGLKVHWT